MRKGPGRHGGKRPARGVARWLTAIGAIAIAAAAFWFFAPADRPATYDQPQTRVDPKPLESTPAFTAQLTDDQLTAAADQLLAATDPERPENGYFSAFARERLRWMVREHAAGRLEVGLLTDTRTGALPPDVLMAAWRADGKSTIFIGRPRFTRFLIEAGATAAPFTQQQKNDFAVGLVHEIVHLQNPDADPRNRGTRVAEESRVWREVNVQVVRPLLARNQPMHSRFRDVDAALRICRDELPCPPLTRLVRVNP